MGEFVISFVDSRRALGEAPTAAALIEKLAATFPGYNDREECWGVQVGPSCLRLAGLLRGLLMTAPACNLEVDTCQFLGWTEGGAYSELVVHCFVVC